MKRIKKIATKNTNKKVLIKKLDEIVSRYIRIRDTDNDGFGTCITCHKQFHFSDTKHVNCGHFVSRARFNTRYNEMNMHFQCVACNCFHDGEQYLHGKYIDARYGVGTADELMALGNITIKQSSIDYENLIRVFQDKCRIEYNNRGYTYENR